MTGCQEDKMTLQVDSREHVPFTEIALRALWLLVPLLVALTSLQLTYQQYGLYIITTLFIKYFYNGLLT